MNLIDLKIARRLSLFSGLGIVALLVVASGTFPGAVAHADVIGAIGCGPDSTVDPTCSGTVNVTTGPQYSATDIGVSLTSISGLATVLPPLDAFQLALLTPNATPWYFTFDTSAGTWTLTTSNATTTLIDTGTITIQSSGAGSVTLSLSPTYATWDEPGDDGTYDIAGLSSGTVTITYTGDPEITGVSINDDFIHTPEPPSLPLLGVGLLGLVVMGRKKFAGDGLVQD